MLYITVECFLLWVGICSTAVSVLESVCRRDVINSSKKRTVLADDIVTRAVQE